MGEAQGEESLSPAIAAQAIEAQPSFGQIKPSEAARLAVRQLFPRRKTWPIAPAQEARLIGRIKGSPSVQMGGCRMPGPDSATPQHGSGGVR